MRAIGLIAMEPAKRGRRRRRADARTLPLTNAQPATMLLPFLLLWLLPAAVQRLSRGLAASMALGVLLLGIATAEAQNDTMLFDLMLRRLLCKTLCLRGSVGTGGMRLRRNSGMDYMDAALWQRVESG